MGSASREGTQQSTTKPLKEMEDSLTFSALSECSFFISLVELYFCQPSDIFTLESFLLLEPTFGLFVSTWYLMG